MGLLESRLTYGYIIFGAMLLLAYLPAPALAGGGHDHDGGHGHDGGHEGGAALIPVTRAQVSQLGIKVAVARLGRVRQEVRIPGELAIDDEELVEIASPVAGFVRSTRVTCGAPVEKGDVLAWIDSPELARAKLAFIEKLSTLDFCRLLIPRAKEVHESVTRLIGLLEANAPEKAIRQLDQLEMGVYRGRLLTAHASFRAAETILKRETQLQAKKINSVHEFLTAETNFIKAKATYMAALDTARFETKLALVHARQELKVAELAIVTAEKQLRLKGLSAKDVETIRTLADGIVAKDLVEDETFSRIALRAPITGVVVEKLIVVGQAIDTMVKAFSVADLSSVRADLAVSQDKLRYVHVGYPTTVHFPDGHTVDTTIELVSPVVARETRTVLARALLGNADGRARPGTFVEAAITVPAKRQAVVIPKTSIQLVYDHPCVFVWRKAAFELREVQTGTNDGQDVEITKGLEAGEKVAAVNAFHLKAEFIKASSGGMGGHGHPH